MNIEEQLRKDIEQSKKTFQHKLQDLDFIEDEARAQGFTLSKACKEIIKEGRGHAAWCIYKLCRMEEMLNSPDYVEKIIKVS